MAAPRTCKSCGAPIIWALTAKKRRMPLDPEPSERGNVVLADDVLSDGTRLVSQVHTTPVPGGYLSHHASCPQGPAWKKKHKGG